MNTFISFALLANVIAVTICYDFSDSLYNEILAEELQEIHASFDEPMLIHHRTRRDEEATNATDKCRPKKKKLCCAEETFERRHEKDKELKRECYKEVTGKEYKDGKPEFDPFRCENVDKHRKEMICVFQCCGQKNNVLDKDGNVKEEEFKKLMKDLMVNETWFASIQDKVIDDCLEAAKNASENHDVKDEKACNPAGIKLGHCLFKEIQMACPAEQIKDPKACQRTKDKIKKYNDFLAPPVFMNDE